MDYLSLTGELRLYETVCRRSDKDDIADLAKRAADAIEGLYLSCNNLVAVVDDMAEDLKKFRWIPVTERLPKIGQEVLVWSYGFINVYTLIQVDERVLRWRDNDGYYQINEDKEFWMPLPEPPESEGEA